MILFNEVFTEFASKHSDDKRAEVEVSNQVYHPGRRRTAKRKSISAVRHAEI